MEYNRAVEKNKPRLIFFIHKEHLVTGEDFETGEGAVKLEALKERVGKQRVAAFFKSPEDLRAQVVEALTKLGKQLEAEAPAETAPSDAAKLHRGTAIPSLPTPYIAHPYTLSQVHDLVGRQAELNALTDWVTDPGSRAYRARLFCFVAIGGMGKSALTWKWFNRIAPEEMRPLAGRLWWSFYESDAAFERFLTRALVYVSGQDEARVKELPRPEREDQLLRHLDERPFLLVLDGLERTLLAYHRMDASYLADDEYDAQTANAVAGAVGLPPSAAQSFIVQHRLRQTTDPRAGAFLQHLAQVQQSRILVSTRLYPSELQVPTGGPRQGCFPYFLSGLSDDDALGLWRALKVSGSGAELLPLFRSVENHPLLVQALAAEVSNYRPAPGNFTQWRADHPGFDPTRLPLVQSRTHILALALTGLREDVKEVLQTLVGFPLPPTYGALDALLVGEGRTCHSAAKLDRALTELEDRGLVGWDRVANRYDAHPIVRGVVWQLTDTMERTATNRVLEAHFESMGTPDDWRDIKSLDDLEPAIAHYTILLRLESYKEAIRLFYDRLEYSTQRLAANRERIEWLERLFPEGVEEFLRLRPTPDEEGYQAFVLNSLAVSYADSGQPGRAVPLYRRVNEICEDWLDKRQLIISLGNFGTVLRETGALRESVGVLYQALGLSRFDSHREQSVLMKLGHLLATIGNHESSRVAIRRIQYIDKARWITWIEDFRTAIPFLPERSLWLRDFNEANALADREWKLASRGQIERNLIRATLFQGQAALGLGDQMRADERLHHALTQARSVNLVELELPALITIAKLERQQGHLDSAKARLEGVWEAAKQGPYPLYQADAYNLLADIGWAEGKKAAAIEAATHAYKAAWCDGPPYTYHWGLEQAKAHLVTLSADKPVLPPFDESRYEPLPEVEINPRDPNWVDPATLD